MLSPLSYKDEPVARALSFYSKYRIVDAYKFKKREIKAHM